jgi:hypothetical protein
VKNSDHFIQFIKSASLQNTDTQVSFDVVSLFSDVPLDEALEVIRNKLQDDHTLAERSILQVEDIMKVLEVCLRTTYFKVDYKFFQQKDGIAMGSSVSPVISTSAWNTMKNWPWTRHSSNHLCGFDMWTIRL